MIAPHEYGSVLWTLDSALRRCLARVESGCDAGGAMRIGEFFNDALEWLANHLTSDRDPWRSGGIWRLDGPRKPPVKGEKKLACELCTKASNLYREIPAASGVVDWDAQRNQLANVDLVKEIVPANEYEMIELKVTADTPEYAAAEIVRYGLLYLLARRRAPEAFLQTRPMLQAAKILLRVWAPDSYYDGYDGRRLQKAIGEGVCSATGGLIADFRFLVLDVGSGELSEVDWAGACQRPRSGMPHIPGPFRLWLRRKLADAPRPLLFDPGWQSLLPTRVHTGFDSPDSSQAFGLNLFAPLALDAGLAKVVLQRFLAGFVSDEDQVCTRFEQSFPEVAKLLNETGIATQVDVAFTITGIGGARHVFIEVKLAEEQFGGCKGWLDRNSPPTRNPDRGQCCHAPRNPTEHCYMAKVFGRTYWKYLALPAAMQDQPCPFRGSLYQLMRNHVLARLMGGDRGRFVVCLHPDNRELRALDLPVLGHEDAISAAAAVLGNEAVGVWNSRRLVEVATSIDPSLQAWRDWMFERYFVGVRRSHSTE